MNQLPPRLSLLKPCPRCGANPSSTPHGVVIRDHREIVPRTSNPNQGPGRVICVTLEHTCLKHQGVIFTHLKIEARTFEAAADEWNRTVPVTV